MASPRSIRRTFKAVYQWTGVPGKTLWDILQLLGVLAIPVVVVMASSLYSVQLNQANLRASEQQHQTDIQIATEQQRETALQNYLDTLSGLLLNNKLLQSKSGDAVREVARVQTLTTLRRLDPTRKFTLLRFLYDANLIGGLGGRGNGPLNIIPSIVSLRYADLTGADLSGADLTGADLSGADLRGVDLRGTDLSGADLSGADLRGAHLDDAALGGADLSSADLRGAALRGAALRGADLFYAHLFYARLTQQQLDLVASCKGAILPTGFTCEHY